MHAPGGIDLDRVFKATLRLARRHEVTVDSSFAALVIGKQRPQQAVEPALRVAIHMALGLHGGI